MTFYPHIKLSTILDLRNTNRLKTWILLSKASPKVCIINQISRVLRIVRHDETFNRTILKLIQCRSRKLRTLNNIQLHMITNKRPADVIVRKNHRQSESF